jgi:carotenoid cleavage dioxygenase-like enzyme
MTTTDDTTNAAAGDAADLPWHLRGNWAPVFEEITATDLPVRGEIPAELNGTYMRNGMNPRSGHSDHWFFGNGMVHGIELSEGRVRTYRNRYVRTPYFEQDMDVFEGFADLSYASANTHIVEHAGKILALDEASWPWEIDRELNTVGPVGYDGMLNSPMTAHPKVCPETGELIAFGYQFMGDPHLNYIRVSAEGELLQTEAIDIPMPIMAHDFSFTRNNTIFMDLPICFDLEQGGVFWNPDNGARLGVMPRDGGNADVVWHEIEPCYVFHPLNAYEDGDKIIIDVARLEQAMQNGMNAETPTINKAPRPWRWTIDTTTGKVNEEQLDDRGLDFSRIDDRRAGLPHRYGYFLGLYDQADQEYGNKAYKYDMHTGEVLTHEYPEGVHGGEGNFVPRSPDAAEDDGFVVSFTHNENTNQSTFVVLDAQDFEGAPLAEVDLPQRVPYGAHGNFIRS